MDHDPLCPASQRTIYYLNGMKQVLQTTASGTCIYCDLIARVEARTLDAVRAAVEGVYESLSVEGRVRFAGILRQKLIPAIDALRVKP